MRRPNGPDDHETSAGVAQWCSEVSSMGYYETETVAQRLQLAHDVAHCSGVWWREDTTLAEMFSASDEDVMIRPMRPNEAREYNRTHARGSDLVNECRVSQWCPRLAGVYFRMVGRDAE